MIARRKAIQKFRRAAFQRLAAGEFLIENEFLLDGIYLAGYSIECSLKALILQRTSARTFESTWTKITQGKKGHEFEFLKYVFRAPPISGTMPEEVVEHFSRVHTWTTDLRYETFLPPYDEAAAILGAAHGIVDWVERSL